MAAAEAMKATVSSMLKGIDRYNPENLATLQKYVEIQARDNAYDIEANLAVLKLYQFNAKEIYRKEIVQLILLKALTNLPHTDFVLCKCLLEQQNLEDKDVEHIVVLHDLLETCQFTQFWEIIRDPEIAENKIISSITGFEDSIRKFICHVVNNTYQHIAMSTLNAFLGNLSDFHFRGWMCMYGWSEIEKGWIFIGNQENNVKTKNITEKIDFDSVATIMSLTR